MFLFCVGILWNLSSKENLKGELAKHTVHKLTEKILVPIAAKELDDATRFLEGSDRITESPSQAEIFCNTTGCLRCTSHAFQSNSHELVYCGAKHNK